MSSFDFSKNQLIHIQDCKMQGYDYLMINDTLYSSNQMKQILIGLKNGIDPVILGRFNWSPSDIKILVNGLSKGKDLNYSNPKMESNQLREIILGIAQDVNYKIYEDEKINSLTMRGARIALSKNKSIDHIDLKKVDFLFFIKNNLI